MKNRDIVDRVMIAVDDLVDDGGYLGIEQSNTFIQMVLDEPTVLKEIRTVSMNGPELQLNKLGIGKRMLHAAPASGTALSDSLRIQPSTGKVNLKTVELIAELNLPYDVLEDNIEKDRFEQSTMELIAQGISLDLNELLILGDTDSTDEFLATQDGVIKLATTNAYTFTAPPSDHKAVTVFKPILKKMPNKYIRNKPAMRFYVSHNLDADFAGELSERQTPMGDTKVVSDYSGRQVAFGVPVAPDAMMPDPYAIFTNPKNLIMGIQRKIQIETDKIIRERIVVIVVTLRVAIAIEEEAAVVVADNLYATATTSA